MSDMLFVFEPLMAAHEVANFTCSKPALHDFLRKHALKNVGIGYAQTFVAVEKGSKKVLGYFSLSATSMEAASLPPEDRQGMPKYPVPGILLAKMGRDTCLDGKNQRLGEIILMEAMRTALVAGKTVGWRFLVVDAYDASVVGFYTKYKFRPLPESPLRLIMSAAMVVKAVAETIPNQKAQ